MTAYQSGDRVLRITAYSGYGDTGTVEAIENDRHGDGKEYVVLAVRWDDGFLCRVYPESVQHVLGEE